MQCIGLTKSSNFRRRCGQSTRFLYCWRHIWQPLIALVAVVGFGGALAELSGFSIRDLVGEESPTVPLTPQHRESPSSQVTVESSPGAIVQTQVDSPNSVQIAAEHVHLTKSPEFPEPKVTMDKVYVNQPDGEKFNTLVRVTIRSPYPVSLFYIKAYAETIENMELSQSPGILHTTGFTKSDGLMAIGARQVSGTLELHLVSAKPENYDLRYGFGDN